MILVDTSVWVDHLRTGDAALAGLLETGAVLIHPFVTGELALGNLSQRNVVLDALSELPKVVVASDAEVLLFIEKHALFGSGIGYIDAHLLASVKLTAGTEFWTNDKRLSNIADRLNLGFSPSRQRGV